MSNTVSLSGRILILGDEPKSTNAISRLLQAAGYDAYPTESFEQAHSFLKANDCALIILDPSSPRLSGAIPAPHLDDSGQSLRRITWATQALEFCKQSRNHPATCEIPVMFLSKSHRSHDRLACLHAGASDFLSKPYHRAELLSIVKTHLQAWNQEREKSERFEQLNVLHAVSSVLSSSLDPDYLLSGTLSVLLKHIHADAGVIYLREEESGNVLVAAKEGFEDDEVANSDLLHLYNKTKPMMNGKPVVLEPIPEAARVGLGSAVLEGAHKLICAPLKLAGQSTGAIFLFSYTTEPFPKQQTDLLATICNSLSVALNNARLYVETRRSAAQLSFVYNLGNNLMTSLEMDELLGYTVFTVGRSMNCDACAVIVKTTLQDQRLVSALYGLSRDEKESGDWFYAEHVEHYIENTDYSVQPSVELRHNERYLKDTTIAVEMIAPLVFDDQLLGILVCASRDPQAFGFSDQKLLGAVAQQLSLAIRNTELYQTTKDTSINLAVEVAKRTREIEEQKRFTEKIIDSLPVSLYVVNRDLKIVAWNRNREVGDRGIKREEVLGQNVFNVLARQPRRKLEDEFTEVFRNARMIRFEQESWVENQKRYWKISKIPMRVDNAEVSHIITVGEDITEQKKMNEAVIHAEKLASIGRLAAGVVHEINNPLATIAACAEALHARLDDLKESDLLQDFNEYLSIIRDEAFRCKTITNNLLEFSHQQESAKVETDINSILDQTLYLIKHHPKLGKMNLVKELDYTLSPVFVNEGQMKQIFIALISNAFDAMEGQGTLTIRTSWLEVGHRPMIAIEFIDTGCGIAPEHLSKIFDPFFTTKPLGRGTGLGLSVCYGIVSEHGGTIDVDSEIGRGATFRVMLPLAPDPLAYDSEDTLKNTVLETESIQ